MARHFRVWADVDLGAVALNFRAIERRVGPSRKIIVVVKADAYGHGAVPVARKVREEGAHGLGVGDSHEAIELREAGISGPILILGAIVEGEIEQVVAYDITTCLHSAERAQRLDREARRQGRVASVHLMVDTGMGRLGVRPRRVPELLARIARCPNIRVTGLCTHFSSAYAPDDAFTPVQVKRFDAVVEASRIVLAESGRPLVHAANSAAIFRGRAEAAPLYDGVRPGAAIYGLNPGGIFDGLVDLEPVLSLRTQVIFLKDVPAGTPIGYNRSHVTARRTRIATLPIGYNDGYPYRLGNSSEVIVRGQRAPVVGAISMDYVTVDVGGVPGVEVGDEVTLIGSDGGERILVEELARVAGSIPYEITCHVGRRVTRLYHDDERDSEAPVARERAASGGPPVPLATA